MMLQVFRDLTFLHLTALVLILVSFTILSQERVLTYQQLFTRWIVRGIYRVYVDSLRAFPGPKLSAFTCIPHLCAFFIGSIHTYVVKLHAKYGDVVRISPDEVSFINPQAWR
jgi:hypothetical protein